jgi:hypothetical protein
MVGDVEGRLGRRPFLKGAIIATAVAVVPRSAGANTIAPTDPLTRSSFSPFLDSTFHIADGRERKPVVLSRIEDISSTTTTTREDRFSLIFKGTSGASFSQSTRRLIHAGRPSVDLFIVPVGISSTSQTYQAIIDRRT